MAEIIPLPNDRAVEMKPIHVTSQLQSFPERFAFRFEWNHIQEKWVMEIEHQTINERVTKGFATPYMPHWYGPFVMFSLIDPSGQQKEVTPNNLGDDIKLFAFPGPGGQENGGDN